MTHLELRNRLMNRVGWKQPTGSSYAIDSDNMESESLRYFQDEHPCVTLDNIYHTMEPEGSTDYEFNAHLKLLKERAIILVVSDVFKTNVIDDNILTDRENILDDCISKRMAIVVGETIVTSSVSNRIERLTKEYNQQLFFELNGNADSSSSRANPNFPTYIGLKSRYGMAVKTAQDQLSQEPALDVFTHRLPHFDESTNKDVIRFL